MGQAAQRYPARRAQPAEDCFRQEVETVAGAGANELIAALTATAQNVEQLLLLRTLHGFTFGAEWAVGAALLAEYANPERRGRTMGFLQSTYAIGWAASTAAYLILFDALNDDQAWRYLFLLGILPAAAAFVIRLTTRDRVKTGASGGSRISFPLLFKPEIRRTTILATLFGVGGQGTYYSVFVFLPTFLVEERGQSVVGTATYSWVVIAGSFVGYILAGLIHDALGRGPRSPSTSSARPRRSWRS